MNAIGKAQSMLAGLSEQSLKLLASDAGVSLPPSPTKARVIIELTPLVVNGTIPEVKILGMRNGVTPAKAPKQTEIEGQSVLNAISAQSEALGSIKRELESQIGQIVKEIHVIHGNVSQTRTEVSSAITDLSVRTGNRFHEINQKIGTASGVSKEVSDLIEKEFGKFKSVVESTGSQTVVADLVSVTSSTQKYAHDLFQLNAPIYDKRGNTISFDVFNDPLAPQIDPDFIWSPDLVRHFWISQQTGSYAWLGGEKGTGKSSAVQQFAARTGRSSTRISFSKFSHADDYLGAVGLTSGSTEFKPGAFLQAFTRPGAVILLDEIGTSDPAANSSLNAFLEPSPRVSYGGKVWTKAANVLIFAADNSLGSGDISGQHAGIKAQNSAMLDRFSRMIPITHLPRAIECEALMRRSGCSKAIADHVLDAFDIARQKVSAGEIISPPSIRQAISFVQSIEILKPEEAWISCVVSRQPPESAIGLMAIFNTAISPTILAE